MNPPTARRRPPQHFVILVASLVALALLIVLVVSTTGAHGGELAPGRCKPYGNLCQHHGTTPGSSIPEETTTTITGTWPASTTSVYLGEDGRPPEARETEAHPVAVSATPTYTG